MSQPIRTAIVGYGLAGRVFHAPFIAADPEFSLDVVVTADATRAALTEREHPGVTVVPDFAAVIDRATDLDLVVVATPPVAHFAQAAAALRADLAVVVDKPFVLDTREGEDLTEIAGAAGRPIAVYQNRRWDGDFLTVRDLIERGALGDVHQFESAFEYWGPADGTRWHELTPPSQGGGVTYDLGSHLIDQALVLFGPVASTHADLRTVRPGTANDDVSFVELIHTSGVRSHLRMNRLAGQPAARFRVLGSLGAYVSEVLDGQEAALASGMSPSDERYGMTPAVRWGRLGVTGVDGGPVAVETRRGDYPAFYSAMADAVRGRGAVPVTAEEALEVTRILEQIRRGAR